jgi:hypothetical protein
VASEYPEPDGWRSRGTSTMVVLKLESTLVESTFVSLGGSSLYMPPSASRLLSYFKKMDTYVMNGVDFEGWRCKNAACKVILRHGGSE